MNININKCQSRNFIPNASDNISKKLRRYVDKTVKNKEIVNRGL